MNECVIEEIKMKNLEENYDIVVVGAGHAAVSYTHLTLPTN